MYWAAEAICSLKARHKAARGPFPPRRRSPDGSWRGVCDPARCSRQCGSARRAGRALRPANRDGAGHAETPLARHLRIGWVAQNGVGNAIERARVLGDHRRNGRLFRLSASQTVLRAVRNLHPTCVNCLAGAHRSPDAGGVRNARMPCRFCQRRKRKTRGTTGSASLSCQTWPRLLLCGQFLGGNGAGGAFLIRVSDLGPKGPCWSCLFSAT